MKISINRVVDFLNEALHQDAESISKVFLDIDMPADEAMIDHSTATVTMEGKLRLLGLLNGLVSDGHSVLKMTIDEDNNTILGFCIGTTEQVKNVSRVTG